MILKPTSVGGLGALLKDRNFFFLGGPRAGGERAD